MTQHKNQNVPIQWFQGSIGGTPFFRINENTPSIYLLPMCWRWRCRARFRCSQFSNLIRASPLRLPDSFKTRDTPPDGIFNPRKKLAFIGVFNRKKRNSIFCGWAVQLEHPNYIMIGTLPGNSSYSHTRIFFNNFVATCPSKKFRIYNLHHVIEIAFEFGNEFSFNSYHVLFQGSPDRSNILILFEQSVRPSGELWPVKWIALLDIRTREWF